MKKPAATDCMLLAGFVAVCGGCWLYAPWCGLVVCGTLLMFYAWKRELAEAMKRGRNRE